MDAGEGLAMLSCLLNLGLRLFAFAVLLSGTVASAAESSLRPLQLYSRSGTQVTLSVEDWKKLPRTTVETVDRMGVKGKYAGVALCDVLKAVQVPFGEGLRKDWIRCYAVVEADDGYQAVYALPELDPAFSDRTILLADTLDGAPLDTKSGPFQVIVPGEKRHARWIKMVKTIRVIDHAPNAPARKKYGE